MSNGRIRKQGKKASYKTTQCLREHASGGGGGRGACQGRRGNIRVCARVRVTVPFKSLNHKSTGKVKSEAT